jgi:hypothetical protein
MSQTINKPSPSPSPASSPASSPSPSTGSTSSLTVQEMHQRLHNRNMAAWRVIGALEEIANMLEANCDDPAKVLGYVAQMKVYFWELEAMPKVPLQHIGE